MDGGLFWKFPDARGKQGIARAAQALLCATSLLLILGDVARADQSPERVESLRYEVANNYSYKLTMVVDSFVQKQAQVKDTSQLAMTYDPRNVSFRFISGWARTLMGLVISRPLTPFLLAQVLPRAMRPDLCRR
jgi:hypothetical protein